ncbi:LLM class flavin-dependent oxidoreductase [Neobacillus piezotolerans]|uniref:LLM class flavin-dependent oxidoreductase n=1 Tax=Neobacillus piezotolerans TaxID=2259171 RepID=A0A3D8GWV2_9BACI|nr:LLM class flavin-dependent oxidoreductase [Neobacillus piezotolerans]RDU38937.1 LLM class flavin-dependent oxidoreductase [Neobacillus piezotolerans]
MKLSILDQSSISSGQTAGEALQASLRLAQIGDELGYTRYWSAEHHDMQGLACSAPEVMIPYIAANTKRIRVGSGAVLLPYYKPYKVAEVFNMLATLFPGRIDIGIGRAPGGSAEATNALSDNFLQQVYAMPEKVEELLHFLYDEFPKGHELSKVTASPMPPVPSKPWLLGTGKKSAMLAAQHGLAYAFGHFMSEADGEAIIQSYLDSFQSKKQGEKPQLLLTVSAVCAETTKRAEEIALSSLIGRLQQAKGEGHTVPSIDEARKYTLSNQEKEQLENMKRNIIVGNPQEVGAALKQLQVRYNADEMMIVTICHSPEDKRRSYKLIAEEVFS